MTQDDFYKSTEAESYFSRNSAKIEDEIEGSPEGIRASKARILQSLNDVIDLNNKRVLEIGCSIGDLLHLLREDYKCKVSGIEPSASAAAQAHSRFQLDLDVSVFSSSLMFGLRPDFFGSHDLVILDDVVGWMDPEFILPTVGSIDWLLAKGGHLFVRELFSHHDFRVENHHHPGLGVFNYRYGGGVSKFFTATGQYQVVWELTRREGNLQEVRSGERFMIWKDSILVKNGFSSFPVETLF